MEGLQFIPPPIIDEYIKWADSMFSIRREAIKDETDPHVLAVERESVRFGYRSIALAASNMLTKYHQILVRDLEEKIDLVRKEKDAEEERLISGFKDKIKIITNDTYIGMEFFRQPRDTSVIPDEIYSEVQTKRQELLLELSKHIPSDKLEPMKYLSMAQMMEYMVQIKSSESGKEAGKE
jgi:hypothetical protein